MNVKDLREKHNLSQAKLAELTGIPKGRINGWEQNSTKPKAEDWKKLESFFKNLENKGSYIETQTAPVPKKVMDMDVWDELVANNATFKSEIDRLWALVNRLTGEPAKAHKA